MKTDAAKKSFADNLKKLYEEDLKDIFWAENHLVKVLPKMAKAADSEELRTAFKDHLAQTQIHVSRLEDVFTSSGLKASSKKCEGMEGLTKEGAEVIEDHEKGCVRDSGLIIAAQKVEHYEISAYGSLRTLAQVMGLEDAAETLQKTLEEEGDADKHLTKLAEAINEKAFNRAEVVEEEN
jgi:ferritin-like metal-binding protein YciE